MTNIPNTVRQQRFRAKHRKLPPWNMSGVIDALILAGDKAVSGNDSSNKGQ